MRSKKTLLAFVAVVLTVGALWFSSRTVTPGPASWEDILAEGKAGGYKVITTDELCDRYRKDSKDLLLIDTRQEWEYRTGHIKGATLFPMEPTAWSRWRRASALETFLGPNKDRTIIFY